MNTEYLNEDEYYRSVNGITVYSDDNGLHIEPLRR